MKQICFSHFSSLLSHVQRTPVNVGQAQWLVSKWMHYCITDHRENCWALHQCCLKVVWNVAFKSSLKKWPGLGFSLASWMSASVPSLVLVTAFSTLLLRKSPDKWIYYTDMDDDWVYTQPVLLPHFFFCEIITGLSIPLWSAKVPNHSFLMLCFQESF